MEFTAEHSYKLNDIFDIKPLKTKTFNMGNFNYNALEKIKISSDFPKYRLSAEESCKSNKSNGA